MCCEGIGIINTSLRAKRSGAPARLWREAIPLFAHRQMRHSIMYPTGIAAVASLPRNDVTNHVIARRRYDDEAIPVHYREALITS